MLRTSKAKKAPTKALRSDATRRKALTEYERKRNFSRTPEPSATPVAGDEVKERLFVVQMHYASH